ncbi:uncharacterized protein LOC132554545 [Ylistrum balloti]|uniref:uncharacterized protein LOC132554545 n=1 Tax=Ylistrum balloti TaxID=509963 RepID=UPI0029059589|nr:uncharacterized protein LOC132554545 [Ylistrum balloti]
MATVSDNPVRLPSDVEKFGEETPLFAKAYSEFFQTGSCLPLLKQELRLKIQNRRMSEGQPELQVQFDEEKKYPLTKMELEKVELRKRHNRHSAKRCREKKKENQTNCVKELGMLKERNKQLWAQFHKLTQWKSLLAKKILKQEWASRSDFGEEDLFSLLPDLMKVHQAEKALFVKNNVIQPNIAELQENERMEWNSELQQENDHSARLQHNNVVNWLEQCAKIHDMELQTESFDARKDVELQTEYCDVRKDVELQTEHCDVQKDAELQTECYEILAEVQANTFMLPSGNTANHVLQQIPEAQSNFTLQPNDDIKANKALQDLQQDQFIQEVELHQGDKIQDVVLYIDCKLQEDTEVLDFPYQQTNAVLQGLDFLLSDGTKV